LSEEYTPELPDDILTRIKYLNEQPNDYNANTDQIIPLKEEDIGKFRPPEQSLRIGVRDSPYLNYRAWGYISEDERIILSGEGEVYLKLDEETFGTNDTLRMMFEIAQNPNLSIEKKMINREIGLRKLISQQLQASVVSRIVAWMKNGRLGR
jgi:hypothetical protein